MPGRGPPAFDPPVVETSRRITNRASYCPETGVVTLRVPRANADLAESFVHELAHHVEYTCAMARDVRIPFTLAGPHPQAGWGEGETWSSTPAERFAEATVELMFGRRRTSAGVSLTDAELEVAGAWWTGRPLPVIATDSREIPLGGTARVLLEPLDSSGGFLVGDPRRNDDIVERGGPPKPAGGRHEGHAVVGEPHHPGQ